MSFAEYARHRQCSKPAVTKAIATGRISVVTDHAGKKCIDSDVADREWSANTAHEKRRHNEMTIPPVAPPQPAFIPIPKPLEYQPPPRVVSENGVPLGRPPAPVAATPQIGFAPEALGIPDPRADVAKDGSDATYSKARALKEHYLAKQAEIEYQKAAGELVAVSDVKKEWHAIASVVRTKILGIPSKAKQRIPDLSRDQFIILEKITRDALEDLEPGGGD